MGQSGGATTTSALRAKRSMSATSCRAMSRFSACTAMAMGPCGGSFSAHEKPVGSTTMRWAPIATAPGNRCVARDASINEKLSSAFDRWEQHGNGCAREQRVDRWPLAEDHLDAIQCIRRGDVTTMTAETRRLASNPPRCSAEAALRRASDRRRSARR